MILLLANWMWFESEKIEGDRERRKEIIRETRTERKRMTWTETDSMIVMQREERT